MPVALDNARFDEDAQRGRVDEVHLSEVDHEPLRLLRAELEQVRAHLGCVVQVEFPDEVDHHGAVPALDPADRRLVQPRLLA